MSFAFVCHVNTFPFFVNLVLLIEYTKASFSGSDAFTAMLTNDIAKVLTLLIALTKGASLTGSTFTTTFLEDCKSPGSFTLKLMFSWPLKFCSAEKFAA